MQSHYRRNLVFSWENLDNAKIDFDKLISRIAQLKDDPSESVDQSAFDEGRARFVTALDNDLNTSLAITALYDVFKLKTNDKTKLALVRDFDRVLSLGLIELARAERESVKEEKGPDIDPELLAYINSMIEARRAAKKEKSFAEADRIRDQLLSRSITLLDTREGTKFTISE
jgi:cysteinyl-tRNA synthetase